MVHPADAARCGVTDAGPARLICASGHAITVEVKVSDEVMPGVISLPHGWGHDLPGIHLEELPERARYNATDKPPRVRRTQDLGIASEGLAWIIHGSWSPKDSHQLQDLWYQGVASSLDTQIRED